jgi:hypothetical protein
MRRPPWTLLALSLTIGSLACDPGNGGGDGTAGWFLVLGGEEPDEGGYPRHPHCLYRVPLAPGPGAEAVYCPDEARWIQQAFAPRPGHDRTLLIVEVDAHSGIYSAEFPIWEPWVQELHLIDLTTGDDTVLAHWLADSAEGAEPEGSVSRALPLDDGRIAVHWNLPEAHGGRGNEVVVVDADGDLDTDLAAGLGSVGLVDALPSGELVLRGEDDEGRLRLLAIDPDGTSTREFAMPAGGPLAADLQTDDIVIDPLGERVLLLVDGIPTIAAADGYAQLDRPLEFGEHLMGWAGDGGALVEHDSIAHWDGTDGGSLSEIGAIEGIAGTSWDCATHPDGLAVFEIGSEGQFSDSEGLAWYHDGLLTPCEMELWSASDPAWAHDTDGPVALAHDNDRDSPTRNQVFACSPDGTASEVLSAHGLRGNVLPSDRIW